MTATPLPPHPHLDRYYDSETKRPRVVSDMFDEGAPYYEWICNVMSFGTGERYRRQALRDAGLEPGMRVLDVATGTGLVLRSASDIAGPSGCAIGLDPSGGMLRQCRKRCRTSLVQGRGEDLPFPSASFDMVSMGYGLRHVADLRALFAEYERVLNPNGRLLVLEITRPQSAIGRWLNRLYLSSVVPGLTRIGTRAPGATLMMEYFWDTIETCVPPDVILGALRDGGFADATRRVTGGVLSEYVGTKRR